ncbi:MAG: hypothetical protein ACLFPL_01615 [Candidatus Nanoarchaeia archaeon]
MALEGELHIILPLVVGFLIGLVEAYFVYEDENMTSGKDFIGDMWHGLLFAIAGTIIATNTLWIFANFQIPPVVESILFMDEVGRSLVVSAIISLIMMTKMVASHAIKGVQSTGFKEKFWHKAVIALAVGFSPYYIFLLYDFIEPFASFFPSWMPL